MLSALISCDNKVICSDEQQHVKSHLHKHRLNPVNYILEKKIIKCRIIATKHLVLNMTLMFRIKAQPVNSEIFSF